MLGSFFPLQIHEPRNKAFVFVSLSLHNRVFSHDVTAVILVSQANPVGVKLFSYANAFSCIDVSHVSENTLSSAIV